jgi:hypothetical protein
LTIVCWAGAIAIVAFFSVIAFALGPRTDGGGFFSTADQVAMVVLGVLLGCGALIFTRAKVDADTERIRVRNPIGSYDLPWAVVRRVRFDENSPWASLDLADDDTVAVMAVQAVDKDRAVAVISRLRELHAAAIGGEGDRSGGTGRTAW